MRHVQRKAALGQRPVEQLHRAQAVHGQGADKRQRRAAAQRHGPAYAPPADGPAMGASIGQAQARFVQKVKACHIGPSTDLFDVLVTGREHPLGVTLGRVRAFFFAASRVRPVPARYWSGPQLVRRRPARLG